ncbi:hypothetical protein DICPUDRAFT_74735 [Dictyostelium purpureum]|uniref:NAD-dependent epimerase/dehydratase domain-containing protein n=1 Tax=Dictyostelium purpureum TaxID=5786 RepID=F0Z8L3_DICPU|nr:uncharacterized protein DICPUDRAFT_74735 [Dictyostelium purpureum]EGC39777.1 hypothetical protein DICPUDRAFT_74735 [Dictyostelium purpureum]|eukprot:XP_003283763.1 hypothetical protein DICPUDRAFT_74735 [Dictyostelium purpureum]
MSTVLVIGAGGFIGSEVSLALVKSGYKVYGLVRKQEAANNLLKNEIIPIVCSAQDTQVWLPFALKVDIIIDTIADLSDYTTPFKVQEALKTVHQERPKTSIIYTSGSLVYGDNDFLVDENQPYLDHGFSQWRIKIEEEYKKIGAVIIQPTILYGKYQSFAGYFFEAVVNQQTNGVVKVYGKPGLTQGFIHIYDLANLYLLAVKNVSLVKGQVIIANSFNEKIEDLLYSIGKAANKPVSKVEFIPPVKEAIFTEALTFNQIFSHTKSTQLLGYHPTQKRIVDDTERYLNAWVASRDPNSGIQKLIDSVVPKRAE